ncbi:hypothetical protein SAMN04489743_0819 [Pseudarthrobacter equi]|uniref:Uncharacterized protein n=1 Tax=Pseudarthrobacter equi TaxID=728066 RepID=A0A1H1UYJ5_9MICC|nr:hypothetical protein [Pseudarthrobacter equi]SDS77166.1 hypothetical protein SAMN04489743_0819 [Pseudarthrobacter equi]
MNDKSPHGSESTRELRDTARRRRDAEEKLQQHLLEARDHVPNDYSEQPATDAGANGAAPDAGTVNAGTAAAGDPGSGQRDNEGA